MGRRKQSRPHRSGAIILDNHDPADGSNRQVSQAEGSPINEFDEIDKPLFVEVDRSCWISNEHSDISEIVLTNLDFRQGFMDCLVDESFYRDSKYSLRFRLCNVGGFVSRMKLGHWPVLSSNDVFLEFIERNIVENMDSCSVILSGSFDGPDEGISGLVHLASLKFMTLRPVIGVTVSGNSSSLGIRVEILGAAFDACESLLDSTRQLWKRSMMNAMAWLRPEVVTSEARYRVSRSTEMETYSQTESNSRNRVKFDVAGFYEAIKPSKVDPMLENGIPDLLPELRPYQRRAAYWMVQRENGQSQNLHGAEKVLFVSPLCLPVEFLDTGSKMFYNPFSGNVALIEEHSLPYVRGGILADEMGMGKTVELLACIFAHRMPASEEGIICLSESQVAEDQKAELKRLKRERVECVCGAVSENHKYKGLWVQCDICDAWQHSDCVGYSPKRKTVKSREVPEGRELANGKRKKGIATNIDVRDGEYICQMCSELIQATNSPVATGATLIVCPAPILSQWHTEIIRHTRPGSFKTFVYEGVRDNSLQNTSLAELNDLIGSDIVLTTYDVLKEDLSHDSDRHEGDRRFMRFQKRYPVIPTPLTRIFWWRVCLDEAQMVESNATAATEMASRLYTRHRWCITGTPIQRKLDDLYGLLRFIRASPFNVSRWWIEVIRDPYEGRDAGAMDFTHRLFKEIMWRTSKINVADELQLPPQEECLTWLTFSPIEEHFYQRQHETCVSYAREVIESLKDDIDKRKVSGPVSSDITFDPIITHMDAAKLLNTLLKLRQACCHPQVGSSGLRSLQQSPMTMDEILMVLVGKTKIEGEEALRRSVVALNALAGIAIIANKFSEAVSLYKEALALAEEHFEDFRLDPLLNIHIHHNLAEILPLATDDSKSPSNDQYSLKSPDKKASRKRNNENCNEHVVKRQKVSDMNEYDFINDASDSPFELMDSGPNNDKDSDCERHVTSGPFDDGSLRQECERIRQKYLAVFTSKLSVAQQEFRRSYMQVCLALEDSKNQYNVWWLEALHHADQNKEFTSDLMRKIDEAISGTLNNSRSSRIASRFQSINALKYHIQTGLDILEASRNVVLEKLLEIDETMEKPKHEDIEHVRYCQNCQADCDGPPCVLCELDELFQNYEARLFRLSKVRGGMITSAEEAVQFQKKKSALNRFYWNLSQQKKNSNSSSTGNEESNKKDVRDVGEQVVVSKHPSELEVVLGVIKTSCKVHLGKEGISAANKQLRLLEGMRKEYAHARSLAIAQAQVLNAHDEIKMATTRLCLRDGDGVKSAYALGEHELPSASVQYSSDKFTSLTLLTRVRGKLRYLQGLVLSKQNLPPENPNNVSLTQDMDTMPTSTGHCVPKIGEETCPVCQEKLSNQKMVFQCGHVTCCKCFFAMTEQKLLHDNKVHSKWVMCPTCRQHTDFGNIAYADDSQNECHNSSTQGPQKYEASVMVQGSYGTKIEAITRRILWIKTAEPKAKVLVFSSWNDVLDVLEHAFAVNGITFVRMKGGRKAHIAINEFRGQKVSAKESGKICEPAQPRSPQVLLLLIQHGANGLNLLEAQHVVLVEPLLNPAAESQAISRVHRIGQENRTLVHRFIVKDTVEESIHKLNRSRNTSSFITGNSRNQDQPFLTLKDVESLFATAPPPVGESDGKPTENLRHLPPSMAAAIAAERRLKEHTS